MMWVGVLLIGCADPKEDDLIPGMNVVSGESSSCVGNAPVIEELECENTGLDVYEQSQANLPTFTISAFVSDEDGDFTSYQMLVKFDSDLDGELGEDAVELGTISGTLNDELCNTTTADVGTKIYIQGGEPDLETTYEWHVSVFDSAGMRSDTEIIECTTPNAEGEGQPY